MKITLTKITMMMMKIMMTKITMMRIMMMTKTTMMMIIITEEEAEEDQETETSKEIPREDLPPEAVEAVLVEDQDVVQILAQEEDEIQADHQVPEAEAGRQAHPAQIMTTMIADTIIREDQEEAGTVEGDPQVLVPIQIPEDQDQETTEAIQDQEITAVQVEVQTQDLVMVHPKEVSLQ
jgi:hypothetical protein